MDKPKTKNVLTVRVKTDAEKPMDLDIMAEKVVKDKLSEVSYAIRSKLDIAELESIRIHFTNLFIAGAKAMQLMSGSKVGVLRAAISAGLSIGYSPNYNPDNREKEIENIIATLPVQSTSKGEDDRFLFHLVDLVWQYCYEDKSVPSSNLAQSLITKATETFK